MRCGRVRGTTRTSIGKGCCQCFGVYWQSLRRTVRSEQSLERAFTNQMAPFYWRQTCQTANKRTSNIRKHHAHVDVITCTCNLHYLTNETYSHILSKGSSGNVSSSSSSSWIGVVGGGVVRIWGATSGFKTSLNSFESLSRATM